VQRPPRPRPSLHTDVPVLVVHPLRDRFLTGVLLEGLGERCRDLRVETLDAGHWAIITHADTVARLLADHVDAH
jgi:pimeloyl-ACP methyl ester carboxylesterase